MHPYRMSIVWYNIRCYIAVRHFCYATQSRRNKKNRTLFDSLLCAPDFTSVSAAYSLSHIKLKIIHDRTRSTTNRAS